MDASIIYRIGVDHFFRMIHNMYDEIIVYDNSYRIVYVNAAAQRHYGFTPDEMVGRSFFDFVNERTGSWNKSILPLVYQKKQTMIIHQSTYLNSDPETIAVPLLDSAGQIEYVVMSVRDNVRERDALSAESETGDENLISFDSIIAESPAMKRLMALLMKVGRTDASCIFCGESGTGKTMLARQAHEQSDRKGKPFVSINCASIPHDLIESELFGYEAGAFTGARSGGHQGLFQQADGGTILLDEIGELPYSAQAKLLHVLQEKSFLPVGGRKSIQVDVKILTATNRDLAQMVKNGQFREDLYYRINTFQLYVPPLRERPEDLKKLIFYFLNTYCQKYNISHSLAEETVQILMSAPWYGNVRELSHTMESLVVMTDNLEITPKDLPGSFTVQDIDAKTSGYSDLSLPAPISLDNEISYLERQLVLDAYHICGSSRKVAQYLKISQTRASKLIRKYVSSGTQKFS